MPDYRAHVHAAGCKDVARDLRKCYDPSETAWEIDVDSRQDATEQVWGDQMSDYSPPAPWTEYEASMNFAPCTRHIPRVAGEVT
jgi:hypothetical protein